MFSKRVFVCHAKEDEESAVKIADSLRGRGFQVFLDVDDCPPGRSYDERIRRAIDKSSVFVFLISPHSVQKGRYTLTELKFAREKRPILDKWVLPVLVAWTEKSAIPQHLTAVASLEPQGNLGAEVSATVASMTHSGQRKMLVGAAALVIFVIGVMIYANQPRPYTPLYNPTTSYTPSAPEYSAVARCIRTGVIGKGTGSTRAEASKDAIEDCIDRGGVPGCCKVQDVRFE
jgi:TIR domain